MKRALAIAVALCTIGVGAFGLGTISGKWEGGLTLLPSVGLTTNKLTLNYTDFGLTFTGVLSLLGSGSDTFTASVSGAFGPFNVNGTMYFDFDAPAYTKSVLTTGFDFGGLGISLKVEHWKAGVSDAPCTYQTGDLGYLRYTFTAALAPITAKLIMLDCCTGTAFDSVLITLADIGLCCGITLDAEFSFTKAGFDYLSFSGIEIPLCCGVSLTAGVKFTVDEKILDWGFDFAGFGDACFTVYADAVTEGAAWLGIEVYGWKIKCTLGDCSYVEFLTALDPDAVEGIVGNVFEGYEFEYIKLGFCGAGCCGGQYAVDLAVYFDNGGGLFGISRIGAEVEIPIMSNLTFTASFSNPGPALSIGWVFTF
ncbi:MAG: hypothetical protein Kow0097_06340 [Candidatus Bipolaricaulota bacterium]